MEILEKPENRDYEISLLAKSEEGIARARELIKRHDFEVTLEGPAKKISLSYKIRQETQAYFSFFYARGSPALITNLDRDLKTTPAVLRFLIVTPPFVKNKITSSPKPYSKPAIPKVDTEIRPSLPLSNEALEKKIEEILQ